MEKPQAPTVLTGIFILAAFYTLYFARSVFLPIVVAVLLNFLLAPLVRLAKKVHIPEPVSALFVILVFLAVLGYGFYSLSGPAHEWLAKGPQNFTQMASKLESMLQPVQKSLKGFFNIRAQIEQSTNGGTSPAVSVKSSDLTPFNTVFTSTSEFFIQLIIILFILYFLLASGDFFMKKTVEILPTLQRKKEAIIIAREITGQITSFLLIKTLTGISLAIVLTIVMYFLKMPSPILWGVLAGLLEFIPYAGVTIGTFFCAITSLFVFNKPIEIIFPPLSFFLITSLAGNFFVPLILSKSLTLHPVIIFLGVIFGGWMWGVVGALIAIPLLSILKIFCNNIPSLYSIGKFLGE
jgi:predicted PurR-regulated permease PerM